MTTAVSSAGMEWSNLLMIFRKITSPTANIIPNRHPPTAHLNRRSRIDKNENSPVSIMFWKIRTPTIADPSFNNDSPSMSRASLSGACRLCSAATTATGSVVDNIDPSRNDTGSVHPSPKAMNAKIPMKNKLRRTPGNASIKADHMSRRNTCQFRFDPDSYNSGGRITKNTISGLMFSTRPIDSENSAQPTGDLEWCRYDRNAPSANRVTAYGGRIQVGRRLIRNCTNAASASE